MNKNFYGMTKKIFCRNQGVYEKF